ncbi:MAG: hypothetical protein ACREK6_04325 [Candidatus Rokuibacteriota bacterium]
MAVVHHETTTGLLNPVSEVARVAAGQGRRVVVDAMSALFGETLSSNILTTLDMKAVVEAFAASLREPGVAGSRG